MTLCDLKPYLEVANALFAILAALLWFIASWKGSASWLNDSFGQFDRALMIQTKFNSAAAFCAGVAAVLQLLLTHIGACRAFS